MEGAEVAGVRAGRASGGGGVVAEGVTARVIQHVPKSVIANTEQFVQQATQSSKNGLSVLGRSLQKHSARPGPFQGIQFSHKTANQTGRRVLREILRSPNKMMELQPNGTTFIYDNVTKRGFSVSRNGVFNGFREF